MVKLNWRKIFDWSIKAVHQPVPHIGRFNYDDPEETILCYSVQVDYNHHGSRTKVICEPNQEAGTGRNLALKYYDKIRAKIASSNAKTR